MHRVTSAMYRAYSSSISSLHNRHKRPQTEQGRSGPPDRRQTSPTAEGTPTDDGGRAATPKSTTGEQSHPPTQPATAARRGATDGRRARPALAQSNPVCIGARLILNTSCVSKCTVTYVIYRLCNGLYYPSTQNTNSKQSMRDGAQSISVTLEHI